MPVSSGSRGFTGRNYGGRFTRNSPGGVGRGTPTWSPHLGGAGSGRVAQAVFDVVSSGASFTPQGRAFGLGRLLVGAGVSVGLSFLLGQLLEQMANFWGYMASRSGAFVEPPSNANNWGANLSTNGLTAIVCQNFNARRAGFHSPGAPPCSGQQKSNFGPSSSTTARISQVRVRENGSSSCGPTQLTAEFFDLDQGGWRQWVAFSDGLGLTEPSLTVTTTIVTGTGSAGAAPVGPMGDRIPLVPVPLPPVADPVPGSEPEPVPWFFPVPVPPPPVVPRVAPPGTEPGTDGQPGAPGAPGTSPTPRSPGINAPPGTSPLPVPVPVPLPPPVLGSPTSPGGNPAPPPVPNPVPTPIGQEETPLGPIGGGGSPPAPTPEGMAAELGRIEQKLLKIMEPASLIQDIWDAIKTADDILDILSLPYGPGEYQLAPVCDRDEEGNLLPPVVSAWPGGIGNTGEITSRLDALAELLQAHKNFKQPICRRGPPQGEEVTVNFWEVV